MGLSKCAFVSSTSVSRAPIIIVLALQLVCKALDGPSSMNGSSSGLSSNLLCQTPANLPTSRRS